MRLKSNQNVTVMLTIIQHCYKSYASLNRYVFSFFLNVSMLEMSRRSIGILFHSLGAAIEKA